MRIQNLFKLIIAIAGTELVGIAGVVDAEKIEWASVIKKYFQVNPNMV